jgi:hypothetical protein
MIESLKAWLCERRINADSLESAAAIINKLYGNVCLKSRSAKVIGGNT